MTGMQWLLVIFMFSTAVGLIIAGFLRPASSSSAPVRAAAARDSAHAATAARLGLTYSATCESGTVPAIRISRLGIQSRSFRLLNIYHGVVDRNVSVTVADVHYVYRSAEGKTVRQTVAAFRLPGANLPAFELEPKPLTEGLRTKSPVLHSEGAGRPAEFVRNFRIYGKQPEAVKRIFDSRLLTQIAPKRGWFIEGEGSWLVVYRHGLVAGAPERAAFIEKATEIMRLFRP